MYAYDVWVNWVDGMCKGYHVLEYHEWEKGDEVELMVQMPVLYVTAELFDNIENGFDPLPKQMLSEIYNKSARVGKNKEEIRVDYAAVLTDGERFLAIDTDGEEVPNFKSRLMPRQERDLPAKLKGYEPKDYGYEPEEFEVDETLAGKILTLEPIHMVGLTRRERQMKELLMDCLFQLSCSDNIEEVRYWFTDLFWGMKSDIVVESLTIEQMVYDMADYLQEGWDEQHEEFGTSLAKYFDNYVGLWEDLYKVKKDKLVEN
jgi:Protein of unknown function (DUF3603)